MKHASPAHSVLLAQPEELCNLDLDAHFRADYVHKTLKCHFKLFNVNLTSCVYSALVSAIYVIGIARFFLFSFYVLQLLRAYLVHVFKHVFSIFKQHYTYFYTHFHPHVFLKNTNNVTRIILLNGP